MVDFAHILIKAELTTQLGYLKDNMLNDMVEGLVNEHAERDVSCFFSIIFHLHSSTCLILSVRQAQTNNCAHSVDPDDTACNNVTSGSILFAILLLIFE